MVTDCKKIFKLHWISAERILNHGDYYINELEKRSELRTFELPRHWHDLPMQQ